MKHRVTFLITLMTFTLFGFKAHAAPEDNFWQWFVKNEPRLFELEKNREAIFDKVSAEMHRVNPDLTFEFGPVENGKREFVISAGGIKSAFPAVEALFNKAPHLERWEWIKFRPRRTPLNDLEYNGKEILVDDVRYLLARDGDKVGIVLFFDGYNEAERTTFGQIGYLFLDEALGEYAVETQVGFIEFYSRESKYYSQSSPLRKLPSHFDEFFSRRAQ